MRTLPTQERLAEVMAYFLQESLEILGGRELGIDAMILASIIPRTLGSGCSRGSKSRLRLFVQTNSRFPYRQFFMTRVSWGYLMADDQCSASSKPDDPPIYRTSFSRPD